MAHPPSTPTESPDLSAAAAAVLTLIRQRDYVTFVEIAQCLRGLDMPVAGSYAIDLDSRLNVVLWAGMSQEFCDVVNELQRSGLVTLVQASVLSYMADGVTLTLPLARRPPPGGYKNPHWAPCCFRPVPPGVRSNPRQPATPQTIDALYWT